MKGIVISFEGIDLSGKTTQISLLMTSLVNQGYKVKCYKFPDRTTKLGKHIDSALRGIIHVHQAVLYSMFVINKWEQQASMKRDLDDGYVILIDRYIHSGIAYGMANGYDMFKCRINHGGLIYPNVTLFLNIDYKISANRSGYGSEIYENIIFQKKVSEMYTKIRDNSWINIEANRDIMEIHNNIHSICISHIQRINSN